MMAMTLAIMILLKLITILMMIMTKTTTTAATMMVMMIESRIVPMQVVMTKKCSIPKTLLKYVL